MRSSAGSVSEYLQHLNPDRRKAISAVRKVIRTHLPKGYEECMNWGMISYEIPLKRYAKTYNGQPLMYAALAAQKNYCSLYLMCAYQDSNALKQLRKAFADSGLKLNMGKSCIRFREAGVLPLQSIGTLIEQTTPAEFIRLYETVRNTKA